MNPKKFAQAALRVTAASILLAVTAACTQQAPPEVAETNGTETKGAEAKSSGQAPKPQAPQTVRVTVPQGTEIHLSLNASLGSATNQPGDTFTARTTEPVVVGSRVAIPSGSTVHGQVSDVVPAKKGLKEKGGSLSLSFDKVVTPGGFSAPMSAGISSVAPKSTKKTAGIIGGSAAGGAILGKVLGGSTKDAAIGAVVGGAIGTGIAAGTRGKEVSIPAGSNLTITLDQPLVVAVKP